MLKKYLLGLLFVLLMLGSAQAGIINVTAVQASDLLQQSHPFLLDVRTPQEYREAHLADATLIPLDQLPQHLAEIPKDRPILVYCAVGSRSARAADYLANAGYAQVYNLNGGIWAWQLRGFPVLKGTQQ